MASAYNRRSAVYGNLAYDLDALARERQLDDAGKLPQKPAHPQPEVQVAAAPRQRAKAQTAVRLSPAVLVGLMVVSAMVVVLMLGYVKLTGISDSVSTIKREIATLEEEHIALLTEYEKTFDLTTVKTAAEQAGMSKPTSGQIVYIDLSGADTAEVYAAGNTAALRGLTDRLGEVWAYVVEYFR